MILFLAKGLALLGVDLQKAQRIVFWVLVAGGVCILGILCIFVLRACSKPPKLDQKEIIKAQQAIEKEDRKQMIEILTNSKVQEQGIDNSIKMAEEATEKAKRDLSNLTNDELAAELEKRLHE